MSEFEIYTKKVRGEVETFASIAQLLGKKSLEIDNIKKSLKISGASAEQIKKKLDIVYDNMKIIRTATLESKIVLNSITQSYEGAENKIKGTKITNGPKGTAAGDGPSNGAYYAAADASKTVTINGVTYNANGAVLTAEGNVDVNPMWVKAEGSAALAKGEGSISGKYGSASAQGSAGEVKAEFSIGMPTNSDAIGMFGAAASVSAALLAGNVEGKLGKEDNNVHVKAEGSLVGAGAEAEAGIVMSDGEYGIKAEAGAEAYLAKGEVSGGFTFLGVDVDVSLEGMVGVQAEAGAEITTDEVEANLGLGPVGAEIKVDWSDFDITFWD